MITPRTAFLCTRKGYSGETVGAVYEWSRLDGNYECDERPTGPPREYVLSRSCARWVAFRWSPYHSLPLAKACSWTVSRCEGGGCRWRVAQFTGEFTGSFHIGVVGESGQYGIVAVVASRQSD